MFNYDSHLHIFCPEEKFEIVFAFSLIFENYYIQLFKLNLYSVLYIKPGYC